MYNLITPYSDILIGRIDDSVHDRIATASEQRRIERVIPNISIVMSNARGRCADPSFNRGSEVRFNLLL